MVNYRRNKIFGGMFFFTVNLNDRTSNLLIENFPLLKSSIIEVKKIYHFKTKAIVILPEHLHVIWHLPPNDYNFSLRWQRIKGLFTHKIMMRGIKFKKDKSGEYNLWQKRFWEHTIKNEKDLENHINYIHYNPLKHHLVQQLIDWPYSSIHHYIKQKMLPNNWSTYNSKIDSKKFGE